MSKASVQQRFTPIAGLALAILSSWRIIWWKQFYLSKKFSRFVWSVIAAATGVSRDTLTASLRKTTYIQTMNFEFSLSEIDFLTHQLYNASKKKSIKNQRRKSLILVTLAFFVLGLSFYEYKKISAYLFFILSILTLIIYPFYLKDYYRNHYLKYVRETLKNRYDQSVIIKFESEHIELNDANSETKINHIILDSIDEIENYIFISLKTGGGIIIPKKKIEKIEKLKEELNKITLKHNLKINIELDWAWK